MEFAVLITDAAERDIEEIAVSIAQRAGWDDAEYVLAGIERAIATLTLSPERGAYPVEMRALGIREFREIFFKPYRIIYRVVDQKVYILVVADGRRDMQTLLQRRLFEP